MSDHACVPVGASEALLLSKGFTDRDIAVLTCAEQMAVVTTEQLARAFFNSPRSAYNRLRFLAERRFLKRVMADPATIRFSTGASCVPGAAGATRRTGTAEGQKNADERPPWNPVFALDLNGYYLLTFHHGYRARNWEASTAGAVTSRFSHIVGVADVWSYMLACARATQETDLTPGDSWRYQLQVGFRTERQSMLTAGRALSASRTTLVPSSHFPLDDDHSVGNSRGRSKAFLRPDAALVVAIRQSGKGDTEDSNKDNEQVNVSGVIKDSHHNPRWDPTLNSWQGALLTTLPSSKVMIASERQGGTSYRSLLLEMETGSNHPKELMTKVGRYNWLIRNQKQAWDTAYGLSPRVLVAVRTDAQVEAQAQIWRTHYSVKADTAVLLVSLQMLSRVYNSLGPRAGKQGRHALLEQPCWLDVMAANGPTWKTLGEALYIVT